MSHIRTKAVCYIFHNNQLLLTETFDSQGENQILFPVGGGVEYGEYAQQAAIREVKEEIGLAIDPPEQVAILENIFHYDGILGHEILFCFVSQINDEQRRLVPPELVEANGRRYGLHWLDREQFEALADRVVPVQMRELLRQELDSAAKRELDAKRRRV